MKKILIVSPFYNGLFRYTRPLYEQLLNSYGDKYEFKHIGNPHMTFDLKEIEETSNKLADEIVEYQPDIIHYNYGTYDIEQLLPYLVEKRGYKCVNILTYHSLQLDIFKKIKVDLYDKIVNEYMGKMDGYVFFTNYAKNIFYEKYPESSKKYIIAFHPATHMDTHLSEEQKRKYDKEFNISRKKKIATLLGYPSHWKDTRPVVELVKEFPDVDFIVAGPWWKEKFIKENINIDLNEFPNLNIINKELDVNEFNYMMDLGVGLFPYKYYRSFQGSGLLPNYLYRGINTLVNNFEPLKEYKKNCIDFYNSDELIKEFKNILNNPTINKNYEFSYNEHANKIEKLYEVF